MVANMREKRNNLKRFMKKHGSRQTVCVLMYVYILHQTLFEGVLCVQEG